MTKPTLLMITESLSQFGEAFGEQIAWTGAKVEEIQRGEAISGIAFTTELKDWLSAVNGLELQGVIFYSVQNMIDTLYEYPIYKEKRFLPIAGDGCGSDYVMMYEKSLIDPPIGMVEGVKRDRINGLCASSLYHFIYYFIRHSRDVEEYPWPGNKDFVLEVDPNILNFGEVPRGMKTQN